MTIVIMKKNNKDYNNNEDNNNNDNNSYGIDNNNDIQDCNDNHHCRNTNKDNKGGERDSKLEDIFHSLKKTMW